MACRSTCLVCCRCVHASNKQVQCVICSGRVHAGCIGVLMNCTTYVYYCNRCLSDALPLLNVLTDDEFYEQLNVPYDSLRLLTSHYTHLKLNLYDFDDHDNFAACSDIDADRNHFNMFNHINDHFDTSQLNCCLPIIQSTNLQSILHLNINNLVTKSDIFQTNLQLLTHKFSILP